MNFNNTALILVGYQNDYFAPDGILRGVVEEPDRVDRVLAKSLELLNVLQDSEIAFIATPMLMEPDYRVRANSVGILDTIKSSGAFKLGSAGADTIPALLAFGDRITYIMGKHGFSAFTNSDLDRVLDEKEIKYVLVAGMVTSLCIDSTGRAAYELGYDVSILSACCSARTRTEQDFYCKHIFPLYSRVIDNRQVMDQLSLIVT